MKTKTLIELSGGLLETQQFLFIKEECIETFNEKRTHYLCLKFPSFRLDDLVSIRLEDLDKPQVHPDYPLVKTILLPQLNVPEWDAENCIEQWRTWRKMEWLYKWINNEDVKTAEVVLKCYNSDKT